MSNYTAAQIPAELEGTFVEFAWRAADWEAQAPVGEAFDAIAAAAASVQATDTQVGQLLTSVCQRAAAMYADPRTAMDHPCGDWSLWRQRIIASRGSPWQLLADTAMLITSPLDIELGLRSGYWQRARLEEGFDDWRNA